MTDKERYEVLLSELAEILKAKNETISMQSWQIDNLKTQLKEAEFHLNPHGKKPVSLEVREALPTAETMKHRKEDNINE